MLFDGFAQSPTHTHKADGKLLYNHIAPNNTASGYLLGNHPR